jgi:outer membrane protein OmpA-like peptidoglycan-associated protein
MAMMKFFFIGLLIISFLVGTMGCAEWNRTAKGAAIGAGAGGAAGGLIGYATGNTAAGVLIGAAVGGAAGALIGNYMDKQASEIEKDIEGAKVERVGKDYSRTELTKLATILNKYDDTNILLAGHTDSTGSDEYNLELSRSRAHSVADYLVIQNVNSERFSVYGYGESEPVATNDTEGDRAQNRRVEIAIWANEKLKKVAQEKTS